MHLVLLPKEGAGMASPHPEMPWGTPLSPALPTSKPGCLGMEDSSDKGTGVRAQRGGQAGLEDEEVLGGELRSILGMWDPL